jgi:hypothetical protein
MRSTVALNFVPLGAAMLLWTAGVSPAGADSTSPAAASGNDTFVTSDSASPADGPLKDRFVVSLGTFLVSTDIKAELNGVSRSNSTVDFNQSLGTGGDHTRGRLDALWRITPTQHVRFLYFRNSDERTRIIDKDINWGDYTFLADGSVTTNTKFNAYELAYEYAFVRPTYEIAGSFGVHYLDFGLKLAGNATITDNQGIVHPATFETKNSNLPAPLPVFGLRGGWAATSHLYLQAQAQVFKFKYEGYDGNWTDFRADATWMFTRHFGAGLGYNRFHVNVGVTREAFNGNLNLGYQGLQAFVTGSW